MSAASTRIVVRPLKKHESLAAARLKVAVLAESWAPHVFWLARHFARHTQAADARANLPLWRRGRTFGAFDGTALVGVSRAILGGLKEVSDLWVIASSRRKGIGDALFRTAEAELRRRGVHTARLYTAAFNTSAIAFYRDHGWRIERRCMHRTSHVRRVRMIKRLR